MDDLEAFESVRGQPRQSLNFGQPPDLFGSEIFPFQIHHDISRHWKGFNRCLVAFIHQDFVVKMQKQYTVPQSTLQSETNPFLLNLGLGNFEAMALERQTFVTLRRSPHTNLVFGVALEDADNILFFEQIQPLRTVWVGADTPRRHRWAIELASASSHLEAMGIVPVKTCLDDIGVDSTGRLKLMGFGASPRRPSTEECEKFDNHPDHLKSGLPDPREIYEKNLKRAHQRLAACLHYILSGIDPDEQAWEIGENKYTQAQRIEFREMVRRGEFPISPLAMPIANILQDSWALRAGAHSFEFVEHKVRQALASTSEVAGGLKRFPDNAEAYAVIERKGREWLALAIPEPRWLSRPQYEEKVEQAFRARETV